MDTLNIILRIVHIFGGFIWFGLAALDVFVFGPMLQNMANQNDTSKSMGALVANNLYDNAWLKIGFPVSATLTFLAGFWLFYRTSSGFDADWMRNTGNQVLSTGVIIGLIALVHGGAIVGPLQAKTRRAAAAVLAANDPTAAFSELAALKAKHTRQATITMVLVAITLLTMASFRYVGN